MSIKSDFIERQKLIDRLADKDGVEVQRLLDKLFDRINRLLLINSIVDIRSRIDNILDAGFKEIDELIVKKLLAFADEESSMTSTILGGSIAAAIGIPIIGIVKNLIFKDAMEETIGLRKALDEFTKSKKIEIRRVITDGLLNGENVDDTSNVLINELRVKQKHQLKTLVRTATHHAAAMARKAVTTKNKHLFSGDLWVSILDSATTLICTSRSGRIYPIGKGDFPPAHWGCRSVRIPILKKSTKKK